MLSVLVLQVSLSSGAWRLWRGLLTRIGNFSLISEGIFFLQRQKSSDMIRRGDKNKKTGGRETEWRMKERVRWTEIIKTKHGQRVRYRH